MKINIGVAVHPLAEGFSTRQVPCNGAGNNALGAISCIYPANAGDMQHDKRVRDAQHAVTTLRMWGTYSGSADSCCAVGCSCPAKMGHAACEVGAPIGFRLYLPYECGGGIQHTDPSRLVGG